MNIGTNIKIVRTARGIKQADIAEQLNIAPNYISMIEANKRSPSLTMIKKIAKVLNVPTSVLVLDDKEFENIQNENIKQITTSLKLLLVDYYTEDSTI
jgi:transcriptional regulator with XRE-family HTH domain